MRLKNLFLVLSAATLVLGCSKQNSVAEPSKPSATGDLLFRVHFAGTAAMTGNSNATYLTTLAALPETSAITTQFCARAAALPARLLSASPTNDGANLLQPLLAELLEGGFVLELRGEASHVTGMALAAKGTAKQSLAWNTALADVARIWFGKAPAMLPADGGLIAGGGAVRVKEANGWTILAVSKSDASNALTAIESTLKAATLEAGSVMQAEISSRLLPGPVQRSVYGSFDRLKLTVSPSEQNLKIRGTANYSRDLPLLAGTPFIPTNLITEPAISFTMVRQPGDWLEPKSVLRRFLPDPVPDTAFFWGGESSPYQLVMIVPFAGRDVFNNTFGPALLAQLEPLAKAMDTGSLILDTNRAGIQWQGVPFVGPQVTLKNSGTNNYLVAEVFPPNDFPPGLTPALLERVSGRTNLLLYDWEFTQLRFDTWFRIGQFALFSSGHQQLGSDTLSKQWIFAAQTNMVSGGNSFTEITQTGPRELTLNRRAPLAFTSTELFWLANWFESANFPAANFLIPTGQ